MKVIAAMLCAFMWSIGTAHAADAKPTAQPTTQQEKMKTCNHEAKEQKLKGDERKAFMSKCLKKDHKV